MDEFMQAAIDQARLGLQEGGIPIGSVLVYRRRIIEDRPELWNEDIGK